MSAQPLSVFLTFLKLGCTSFGGPIAHLGYFRKELVERQKWVTENQFGQLLAICQFLPGPASSQLGFALGLLRGGWLGALAAFLAFTLPSALLLVGFALLLPNLSGPLGTAAIHGLKLVACAVVADAVLGMSRKLCTDVPRQGIAVFAAAAILMAATAWAQIFVVLGGALAGILWCRNTNTDTITPIEVGYRRRTGLILLTLFLLILLITLTAPGQNALFAMAQAFYNAGALVFGGGHVVLPLLQDSVVTGGWVSDDAFLTGYGASQAIPGPMFSFSAYLGAIIQTGQDAWTNAAIALAFMFLPGFLLISAALPLWQSFSKNTTAVHAIAGLNAAVVGILAAALYDPIFTSGITSPADLAIALIGLGLLRVWKRSPLLVVIWCVAASMIFH